MTARRIIEMDTDVSLPKVTRLTIVDGRAAPDDRLREDYGVTVNLSIQDDGRTLKVFIDGADQ